MKFVRVNSCSTYLECNLYSIQPEHDKDICFKIALHHRTQGRGVEAVHIRGVVDALRSRWIPLDMLSLPNADPYEERKPASGAAKSPCRKLGHLSQYLRLRY